MSIVVYWLGPSGEAGHRQFADSQFVEAMAFVAAQRALGLRHVSISSELEHVVGKPGVDAVTGGTLPSGEKYEWSKQHRGSPHLRGGSK